MERDIKRAQKLRDFMNDRMRGIDFDWSKHGPRLTLQKPLPAPSTCTFERIEDMKPVQDRYVYERTEDTWYIDGVGYPAVRVECDGLIIDASYQDGDDWIFLLEEIGKAALK